MFTIMRHLPTLGNAVIRGMDVESVTQELQSRSRLSKARAHSPNPPSESSLGSSVEFVHPSAQASASLTSQADVESPTGTEASAAAGSSDLSNMDGSTISTISGTTQAQSWVQDFGSASSSQGPTLAIPAPSSHRQESTFASSPSNTGAGMSDSMLSDSLTSTSVSERDHSRAVRSPLPPFLRVLKMLWRI